MCSPWEYSRWEAPRRLAHRLDADSSLRVSDAERNEVADMLSEHYADGRLDAAELKDRLDQAMGAKTRADLSGLLTDLPRSGPATTTGMRPRRRLLALLVLGCFVTVMFAIWPPHVPWLLIAFVVLWVGRRRHSHWPTRFG